MNPEVIAEKIYIKYPEMQPYVGEQYRPAAPWSILLIGENFYQENGQGITQHLSPDTWYEGDYTGRLQNGWINTQEIISKETSAGFPNKAHLTYKRPFLEINNAGPGFQDWREIAQYLTFVNYFHRPAEEQGGSICVYPIDREVAELILLRNIERLRPKLVAFISRKAFRHFNVDKLKE